MFDGKELSGAANSCLHFIGDEHDAMLAANFLEDAKKLRRWNYKSTFAENGLDDYGGDGFGGDQRLKAFSRACAQVILQDGYVRL